MILCNVTFSIVTDESAADGDCAECGMLSENVPFTFRELVEWMRHGEASAYPASGDCHEWVTQDQGETRAYFERGEREERSIHYNRDNPPHKAKYWGRAMRAAGLHMRAAQ